MKEMPLTLFILVAIILAYLYLQRLSASGIRLIPEPVADVLSGKGWRGTYQSGGGSILMPPTQNPSNLPPPVHGPVTGPSYGPLQPP